MMIGITRAALLTAAACLHSTDGVPTASATATSAGAGSWPANGAGLTARDAPLSVRVPSGLHDRLERFRAASTPLGGGRDAPDNTVAKTLSVPGNDVDMQEAHETLLAANDDADAKSNRHKCVQNLKLILIAVDDYHTAHGTLPAAYSVDKGGRPLLSWRVHILPFLGQKPLYDRFHLDEPWDSPHNKALVSLMPAAYACPGGSRKLAREGKTSYLTPRGPATAFPGSERATYEQITDGRPSTVLIVEATDSAAVFWTKPEDWDVGREPKTRALFGRHFQGTHFLFADTSVHFIRDSIKPAVLKAIFTRNGNEAVDPNDY